MCVLAPGRTCSALPRGLFLVGGLSEAEKVKPPLRHYHVKIQVTNTFRIKLSSGKRKPHWLSHRPSTHLSINSWIICTEGKNTDQGGYEGGGPRNGWVTVEPELTQSVTEQGPNTQSGVGTTVYSAAPIRHFTASDLILRGPLQPHPRRHTGSEGLRATGRPSQACRTAPHWASSFTSHSGGLLMKKRTNFLGARPPKPLYSERLKPASVNVGNTKKMKAV